MEKETKKLKGTMFVVEVIQNLDDHRTFIVRTPQGTLVRFCDSADDVATFFSECEF